MIKQLPFLLGLAVLTQAITFEVNEVKQVVDEIKVKYAPYIGYDGSSIPVVNDSSTDAVLEERGSKRDATYWYEQISHKGIAATGPSGYQVYRNVKDFGAKGDGVTDDTAAINAAISSGGRCGRGCTTTSTTPAVVYFPSGTYLLSSSIIDFYFTQLIGNPNAPPVLKARADFQGFGIIDGDPYFTQDLNWISTNVFLRQVRNFVLDTRNIPSSSQATGIHWPTAQATSLQNVVFELSRDAGNKHTGLFCESGSAGFMTDLTFNGGVVGASIGNQQFTMRNLTFNGCDTAISQLWSWGWVYQGISINNCKIGLDISAGDTTAQTVGSMTLIDSSISNTPRGIVTSFTPNSKPTTAGSLIVENVKLSNVPTAIQAAGSTVLAGTSGSTTIAAWGQGNQYTPSGPKRFQGPITAVSRPSSLIVEDNKYYTRSKPQYNKLAATSFVSVRSAGATGNGKTDDTNALQEVIESATADGKIVYFDCGMYKITSTLFIPPGAKIVGEGYATILSSGPYFNDMANPRPVVKVGNAGDSGKVEWSDMLVSGQGQQAGAIFIEWNLASTAGNPSGLWDVHVRVGGIVGSNIQVANCAKTPGNSAIRKECIGGYMLMHVTKSAQGLYMENVWLWTADHDVDDQGLRQIDVYVGRGLLIESTTGNIWLVGTGVEHNTLYQYQLYKTQNIYMGFAQIETPYYQPNPPAPAPFTVDSAFYDPDLVASCGSQSGTCRSAWGLRTVGTSQTFIYGLGLYSFFSDWSTTCSNNPGPEDCQNNIFSIENSKLSVYNLATVGTTNMITVNGATVAKYLDNQNVFPQVVALFRN